MAGEGPDTNLDALSQGLENVDQPTSVIPSVPAAAQPESSTQPGSQRWSTITSSPSVRRKPVGSGQSIRRKPVASGTQLSPAEPKPVDSKVQPAPVNLQPTSSGEAVVSNIQRVLQAQITDNGIPPTTELAIQNLYYRDESQMSHEEKVLRDSCRDIAARIIQEPELFMEVRNLVLYAKDTEILKLLDYLENNNLYGNTEDQEAKDWIDLIRALCANGPFTVMRVLPERLKDDHHLWAGVARTMLLDPTLNTKAQYHSLEPGPNAPTNKSFFPVTPIPFPYDNEEYQTNSEYRYWIGERTLHLTETTTLEAYRTEVSYRYRNRKKLLQPFVPEPFDDSYAEISYNNQLRATKNFQRLQRMAENAELELNTTGWTRNPGLTGPPLGTHYDGFPKLPEMHTGVSGEHHPDNSIYLLQTLRFPQSRNWTTKPELVWFPLSLPSTIHASDFRIPPPTPELLFTDRFNVTMRGVFQTQQCTSKIEHPIFSSSIASLPTYDSNLSSHGLTYTDYRRCITALLYYLSRENEHDHWTVTRRYLKQFFYDATVYLRARGIPVVIKFKFVGDTPRGHLLWASCRLEVRCHPFDVPLRGGLGKR